MILSPDVLGCALFRTPTYVLHTLTQGHLLKGTFTHTQAASAQITSAMGDSEEDESNTNEVEGDIFDFSFADDHNGIDPTQSLKFFRSLHPMDVSEREQGCAGLEGTGAEGEGGVGEEEDQIDDLRSE